MEPLLHNNAGFSSFYAPFEHQKVSKTIDPRNTSVSRMPLLYHSPTKTALRHNPTTIRMKSLPTMNGFTLKSPWATPRDCTTSLIPRRWVHCVGHAAREQRHNRVTRGSQQPNSKASWWQPAACITADTTAWTTAT